MENRRTDLDLVRIFACLGVILNHTINVYDNNFAEHNLLWVINCSSFYLCKTAVPLFLIISGALLLKKEDSLKKWITKRVVRMIAILIIWSLLYRGIYTYVFTGQLLSFGDIKHAFEDIFIIKPISRHFWYLYVLISFYLCLPFFQSMSKSMTNNKYLVFIVLWLVIACFIPEWNRLVATPIKIESHFNFSFFTGYFGYCLMGPYLDNIHTNKKNMVFAILAFICSMLFNGYMTYKLNSSRILDDTLLLSEAIVSIALFFIIKKTAQLRVFMHDKVKLVMSKVSETTFGVYLMHIIVIFIIQNYTSIDWLKSGYTNSIFETILFDIIVFVVCSFATFVLQKIPVIRKIVS